ncbi:unnamed protein product [Bathycoccus prasinos]
MELNDSVKNGDVETGWDSSEVGANAEIEYVPLMRVENSSSTNMTGGHIIQNIPPSSDNWGMGIFFAILSAPFFVGAVLGVRFCWLYGYF